MGICWPTDGFSDSWLKRRCPSTPFHSNHSVVKDKSGTFSSESVDSLDMSLFAQVLSSEYDLLLSWDFVVAKIKTFMYVCVYVGGLILLVIPVMPVIFAEVGCTLQPQHLQTPASLIDWTSTMSSSR